MTENTKKYKKASRLLTAISFAFTILPLLVYVVLAFAKGAPMEKVSMGAAVIVALILVLINIIFKYNLRSTMWVLLLGIYICLDKLTPLLIILAVGTILDEFLVSPARKKYKNLFTINKEIDKR